MLGSLRLARVGRVVQAIARCPPAACRAAAAVPSRTYASGLPDHIIVRMPALSPTMTQGTLVSWSVDVGDEVAAGDQLGEIETDKATMSFDSTEDGFVAKHLVEAGTECKLGTPVLVICEDQSDVAAFANFEAPADEAAAPAPKPAAPTPKPAPAAPAPVAQAPVAAAAAKPPSSGASGPLSALDAQLIAIAEAALKSRYPNGVPTSF